MLLNHNAENPIIPPRVLAYTVMNGLVRLWLDFQKVQLCGRCLGPRNQQKYSQNPT